MDNLRKTLGMAHGKHTSDEIVREANAAIEKLRSALIWYQERVQSICKPKASATYIEAIFTELTLDAGKRATDALPSSLKEADHD